MTDLVRIAGIGMTEFGKFPDLGLKGLSKGAVDSALTDAGIQPEDVEVAVVGNAVGGLITGQEMICGQVVLRESEIGGIPIYNVENACASSSTALNLAWMQVQSGAVDVALAVGVEKLTHEDKKVSLEAFSAAVDVEFVRDIIAAMQATAPKKEDGAPAGEAKPKSMFMDIYAAAIRGHMKQYGTTQEQIAQVCVKSHHFGALNPKAQYRNEMTLEEVLGAREVAWPLTVPMCAPIGDGAAAIVLVSADYAKSKGINGPGIAASVLKSGRLPSAMEEMAEVRAARAAYEMAGLGPDDIDVAEVHDATAAAEILAYEDLEFCPRGDGGKLVDEGATALGGRIPVNTSGGLCAKGHPIGASGIAQVCEVGWQLRGECGARQVEGARIGLTQNGGGFLGNDAAAQAVHILVA
ncbi:MAG: thiolase family protein [Acidimicrobiia bacterium]|nr:thiolase family protein [Acidimicrobiia bacterium]